MIQSVGPGQDSNKSSVFNFNGIEAIKRFSTLNNREVTDWDEMDVACWLVSVGLEEYSSIFYNKKINGVILKKIAENLKERI